MADIPSTHVLVECDGCHTGVNIRVGKKHNGRRIVSCHNCLHVIEVDINNMKSIQVWISNQNGSNRHRATYEKVWQE